MVNATHSKRTQQFIRFGPTQLSHLCSYTVCFGTGKITHDITDELLAVLRDVGQCDDFLQVGGVADLNSEATRLLAVVHLTIIPACVLVIMVDDGDGWFRDQN